MTRYSRLAACLIGLIFTTRPSLEAQGTPEPDSNKVNVAQLQKGHYARIVHLEAADGALKSGKRSTDEGYIREIQDARVVIGRGFWKTTIAFDDMVSLDVAATARDLNQVGSPPPLVSPNLSWRKPKKEIDLTGLFEVEVFPGYHALRTEVVGLNDEQTALWGFSLGYYPSRHNRFDARYLRANHQRHNVNSLSLNYTFLPAEGTLGVYFGAGLGVQSVGAVVHKPRAFISVIFGMRKVIAEKTSIFLETRPVGVFDQDVDSSGALSSWTQILAGLSIPIGGRGRAVARP